MPDYEYDVFISYERDGIASDWITEHFLPLFRYWLRQNIREKCGRPAQHIFFDRSQTDDFPQKMKLELAGIRPGADWDKSLREAICVSRCMVGIWNPTYFDSHWCNIEWESFDRRAQATGKTTLVPTRFHDGNSFPERAAKIQAIDLSEYTIIGQGLVNSRKYEPFQDTVKRLAVRVAEAVRDAPAFQPWPVADDIAAPAAPPLIQQPRL